MPDQLRDRVLATLGDAYDLDVEIGRGGMGVVYRCRDRKLRRLVAVKVLPPDLAFRDEVRTRFLREAETAAQLSHQNIVPIYSVDEKEGLVWFVMALVDGESLAARLAREPRPPLIDVRRVLQEVADALAYAHARGIVHRDIKPDNILLDRLSGRALVTDFGIARAAEGDSRLTVTGSAVGTPAYMSPEQATGEREVDGRSDQYSLAVVGYQMLVGELPFKATNTPSMLMKHISDPLRPVHSLRPDAPPALAAAVERALAKKPSDRYRDASAFREAVMAADLNSRAEEPRPGERLSAAWKRPAAPPRELPADPAPVRLPRLTRGRSPSIEIGLVARVNRPRRDRRGVTPDAVEAANAGWRDEGVEALPPIPSFMPPNWKEARREWRQQRKRDRLERRTMERGDWAGLTREERIRQFRRRLGGTAITIGMLAGINLAFSPGFAWFVFPAAFMTLGLLRRGTSLWADGLRLRDVFGREAVEKLARPSSARATASVRPPTPAELAEELAPRDVVVGPYGSVVVRAATDRAAARDALVKLAPADRELIPDVGPTVDALAERVGSIATAMHRMDEDVTPEAITALERRIEDARSQAESPEREQRLSLLQRQRSTLDDLLKRRDTMRAQLDSASLMLQNMHLDLLALRSAGVQSVLNDVSTATQEARALSRDIQIALEAAKEIRS